ncbi:MAG: ABC transporter substrate-binding protein [Bacteroidota bacterium]
MTLGILYPRSAVYPDMGVDFVDGLKSFIQTKLPGNAPQLYLEGIGFGGAEKEVYDKAEKLLRFDKVDILIAFIDLRVLPILEPLVYSLDKLLVVVNAGANYPTNWIPQPNVVFLGLQHAFLCWMAGMEAAHGQTPNAALATSFYDCGYLHSTAIVNSFVQHGGNLTHNFVYNKSYDAFDIAPLTDFLSADNHTNKILCVYDTLPGGLFYSKLKNHSGATGLELFVSPMMLEDTAIEELRAGIPFEVTGYRPWDAMLEEDANQSFKKAIETYSKKAANIFSLLGWETGLVIEQILSQPTGQHFDGSVIAEQLKQVSLSGPRGTMQLDNETHYFLSPIIRSTVKGTDIVSETVPVSTVKQYWTAFTAQPVEGITAGWTNTYLCY